MSEMPITREECLERVGSLIGEIKEEVTFGAATALFVLSALRLAMRGDREYELSLVSAIMSWVKEVEAGLKLEEKAQWN